MKNENEEEFLEEEECNHNTISGISVIFNRL